NFSHSIRFSYLKFQNQIVDIVKGSSLPLSSLGVTLSSTGTGFYGGPSPLAPQSTPQSNTETKYDGSKLLGAHLLRYGVMWNHIQGGGFANFYGTAPRITWLTNSTTEAFAAAQGNGGASNPLNYPVNGLRVGNGLGFNTLEPALGFPAGGLGPDNRIGIYFGDVWKYSSNSTITLGIRWDRDTGRTDSDLGPIPEVNAVFPGLGNPVRQANANFSPQMGFTWDPFKTGKTAVRGGIGLFYENVIYNNVLFDRPYRLRTGAFNQVTFACTSSVPQPVQTNAGPITPGIGVCNNGTDANGNIIPITVGQAIPNVLAFWQQVLAGNPLDLKAANPNFIGNYLNAGLGIPLGFFAPDYKTPRSIQINIGVQRELRPGMVLSVDYLRNVQEHTLLGIDENHVGDTRNFNLANARAAIAATNAQFNCSDVDCAVANGAQMTNYANNGLTADTDFGQACIQALGVACAFSGQNPSQAASVFLEPRGRAIYNAMQLKLIQNMKHLNFQFSYSLSRLANSGGSQVTGTAGDSDQDFVIAAADNNNPNRYFGPNLLDRTHQFSFGGFGDLPWKFNLGLIAHFYSPLSSPLVVPNFGVGPGEIFRSDFTGDGTTQDLLPGTHMGNFGRGIDAGKLTGVINNYNSTYGNQPTPAGLVLIRQGLMTASQLQALGGVAPILSTPPSGQVNYSWLRALDLNVGWKWTFMERFSIQPSVAFFNLFNFGNFNLPPNTMSGLLSGSPGAVNGTDKVANETFRVGNGTGVYALGSARRTEWGLKFTF
ncbi:MAG TPA: TonB-dependent receptor, partial [Pseudacidobacterium sp.]|nr:TonB-dependent receptor [Pseudacidobacterium sp.]